MPQSPKVQVLLPVFNAEPYLAETLESMLSQTFTDWELLIIDDGSVDASLDIIEKFCQRDSRIQYRTRLNQGLVKTLQELVQWSSSELVARLDADDLCHPERLKLQLDLISGLPKPSLVGSWVQLFGAKNEVWHYRQIDNDIRMLALFGRATMCHGALLGHRDIFLKYPFDRQFERAEELDFFLRLMRDPSIRFSNVTKVLYSYRQHHESVVHRFVDERLNLYKARFNSFLEDLEIYLTSDQQKVYFEFLYEPNRLTASELPSLIAVFKLINKLVDDEFPGFLNEAERRIKNHFGINSPVFTEN